MKRGLFCSLLLFFFAISRSFADHYPGSGIRHNSAEKTILLSVPDKSLSILIDYSDGCRLTQLTIKGQNTLSPSGVNTGIQLKNGSYFSTDHQPHLKINETDNRVNISGITYGDATLTVNETWNFRLDGQKIIWTITRDYSRDAELEDMSFPTWNFASLSVWKGGILDNGGMVWCKYLKEVNDTYGVHTGGVTFWNAESGDGLGIMANSTAGNRLAAKYSHSQKDEFSCTQLVSNRVLDQRYNLSRFIAKKADVFAPFAVRKGRVSVQYELEYIDYFEKYSRGTLTGIDAVSVRELLNTTGRYGVVDNNIVGGNGWLTNWKCMHEPFFAQMGMALDDRNYTRNFSSTLDQERDEAMQADGRVLSRWHNVPGDEIPGTYNAKTGYYEAMWGYTIDSQTGYVINASEQFDLSGDRKWLQSHQISCEKALDWLIKRDSNHNGIFEMMNNNIADKKASDWVDIVWASYENAFVNAQLYEALTLWAQCESVLGNLEKSGHYLEVAGRLKTAFNKTVEEGGFWSPEKKQYIYWRDQDGSTHGDNLVTPVNFAAIAFGLCDDPSRIAQILDQIEQRTAAESLFHWPLCFDSFKQPEVQQGNWPFPKYENGDIFPTWGYLGVRAYAGYNKDIALKYIRNILTQYKKDGLSSQRYSRTSQLGMGEDVLAGISTTISGLYRDIYGVRPKWNRMGLEPHMSNTLDGTVFTYTLRDTVYRIKLSVDMYSLQTDAFSVRSKDGFGAAKSGRQLIYYHQNRDSATLCLTAQSDRSTDLLVNSWDAKGLSWEIITPDSYTIVVTGLPPGAAYVLSKGGAVERLVAGQDGRITFHTVIEQPLVLNLQQQF